MAYGGKNKAWIVGAVHTPISRHGGSLSAVRPDDLGVITLEALAERIGVPPRRSRTSTSGARTRQGRTTATSPG
jgi:acetyl-CoA acetyltransferase